jgi:Niemann-Pick C1 protein
MAWYLTKAQGQLDLTFNIFDRNTYDYGCLAPYGGPVEPGVALGGLEGSDFSQATGLSISFMVNNHHNKTELLPAMEWELR